MAEDKKKNTWKEKLAKAMKICGAVLSSTPGRVGVVLAAIAVSANIVNAAVDVLNTNQEEANKLVSVLAAKEEIVEMITDEIKGNFEKALLEYPIDFEQALINLENSSKNKDFQALISTLRQCATSDKYAALQTLQRRRISRKEYRKLMEEKKIETKTYIGLVLLIPVLFFLAKLLLAPWSQMITGSGLM